LNIDVLRSLFEIVEQGSLSKAAERLRVSQSTLTRQMHSLERDLGGKILERSAAGVALTASGHALVDAMRPVVVSFDAAIDQARKLARGQSVTLRIGYLMSAAPEYLHPAMATLRRTHPEIKLQLRDLSPGEQIEALRKGEIDLAMAGNAGPFFGAGILCPEIGVAAGNGCGRREPCAGTRHVHFPE
jgi:DNA-binding transcriptional LysR family regulator